MDPTEAVATVHAPRAADMVEKQARALQVPEQLDLLTDDVSRLQALVDELEARLAGAGALQSHPEGKLLDSVLDELVPLADRIRAQRHRIQSAADQVSAIFSRLEV